MEKHLKAELWEIQIILFLILATQVPWEWARITLCIYSFITFIGTITLKIQAKIEDKKNQLL